LVEIPYWWDPRHSFVVHAVRKYRPDLLIHHDDAKVPQEDKDPPLFSDIDLSSKNKARINQPLIARTGDWTDSVPSSGTEIGAVV